MISFVTRRVPQVYRAVVLARKTPHYLIGRFGTVRKSYSLLRGMRHPVGSSPEIQFGDLYGRDFVPVPITPSGLVASTRAQAEHLRHLKVDSVSSGLTLGEAGVEELVAIARTAPLKTKQLPTTDYATITASPELLRETALGTVKEAYKIPALRRIAADPLLVDLASAALGYHPEKVSAWLFWSFANDLAIDEREYRNQTVHFHYDVDGYNFFYVSFYLLPTDRSSGAHVVVKGTHRRKHVAHLLGSAKLSDEQVAEAYGSDRIEVMTGPAGTGFIEDASCYHKALPPTTRERLMLQLRFQ